MPLNQKLRPFDFVLLLFREALRDEAEQRAD